MFKVKVTGVTQLQTEFRSITKDLPMIVSQELRSMGADWVVGAVKDAPKDEGRLKGSISYYMVDDYTLEVVAQAFYAPFMEFGTKGRYRPIPGTEAIASQFKGYKGGDFMDLLRNIVRWVKRKGIAGRYSVKTKRRLGSRIDRIAEDYAVAWPIALSILRNGLHPHPFFFKQMDVVWPKFIRQVNKRIEQRTKVSVVMPGDITRPRIVTI